MRNKLLVLIFILASATAFAQRGDKLPRFFGNPIVADSASALMIPVQYNVELLSANKLALWNHYYANIIFYDITNDSSKRLFKEDTFIKGFANSDNSYNRYDNSTNTPKNISANWIFYFVMEADYNKSGRIDSDDPAILYVSDKQGNKLKALTPPNENAVSIEIFEKQGFALVKMQRDVNNDKSFDAKDKDFYYVRLDLNTLMFGNKIELKGVGQL